MSDTGSGTVSTKPPTWSLELLFVVLSLTAQAMMTVELFEAGTVPGKLVSIVGIVLTGLGYTVARAKAAKSVLPTALFVGLFALFFVAQAGCTTGQRAGAGRIAGDLVDCMTPSAKDATGQLLPVFADALRNATADDGSIDKARITSVGKSIIAPTLQCAFVSALAEYGRQRTKDPNAPQSAEVSPNHAELAAALEELRAEWGGPRFKLEGGTL